MVARTENAAGQLSDWLCLQAGPSAHYADSHPGSGPIPTAAPLPPSPNMDTTARQQDRGTPVRMLLLPFALVPC